MWAGAVLGLRWAEAAGLSVDRLDVLGATVRVDRQLARTGELVAPKSAAGTRTLAGPSWLVDQLAQLLARRGLSAADGLALLWVRADGRPLDYSSGRLLELAAPLGQGVRDGRAVGALASMTCAPWPPPRWWPPAST
jgi:hypothetical protein